MSEKTNERLRNSMSGALNDEQEQGKVAGRNWVLHKNGASYAELHRLEEQFRQWDDAFFQENDQDAYSVAERLVFVICPDGEGDRKAARAFWENWADEASVSGPFVEGFIEGAMEVWD